jgi:hypothetical protein
MCAEQKPGANIREVVSHARLRSWGCGYMMFIVQEVLSMTDDPKVPLRDQEFYELRLYDSDSAGLPVYCVREARTRWDNEVRDMVRDKEQERTFVRQQEAEEWYEARRRALAKEGFIYSDMDF